MAWRRRYCVSRPRRAEQERDWPCSTLQGYCAVCIQGVRLCHSRGVRGLSLFASVAVATAETSHASRRDESTIPRRFLHLLRCPRGRFAYGTMEGGAAQVSNKCIAVRTVATPLRELTCHMGSHSVTCHPAEVTFPPLPQPKLVLDLATPEGCKAELT